MMIKKNNKSSGKNIFISFKLKMLFWFGFALLSVLILSKLIEFYGIPLTTYKGSYYETKISLLRQLQSLGDTKKEVLERWIKERKLNLRSFCENEILVSYITTVYNVINKNQQTSLLNLAQDNQKYQSLLKYLNHFKDTYGIFDKIQLADLLNRTIIASTDINEIGMPVNDINKNLHINIESANIFCEIEKKHNNIGDEIYIVLNYIIFFYKNGFQFPIIVKAYLNTQDIIKSVINLGNLLGKSGDVVLVDNKARILIPLKYPLADGRKPELLEYGISAKPANLASKGEEGLIVAKDYREVEVLAAYRHISVTPDFGLGLVIKSDKREAFAPIRHNVIYFIITAVCAISTIMALTYFISRKLSRPLKELTLMAQKVESGDLNSVSSVNTNDEFGILSSSFNSMVDHLRNWYSSLDNEVTLRTKQLRKLNNNLTKEIIKRKKLLEQSETINLISKLFLTSENINHVFDELPKILSKYLKFPIAAIELYNESTNTLDIVGETGFLKLNRGKQTSIEPNRILEETISGIAFKSNETIIEIDITNHPSFRNYKLASTGVKTLLCAPLKLKNSTLGVLSMADRKRRRDAIDIKTTLEIISAHLAQEINRKNVEEELVRKNNEMEAFVYSISHDLKSPLVSLQGFFMFLLNDNNTKFDDNSIYMIERIKANIKMMENLIGDLLELSRIGRVVGKKTVIPVKKLCDDINNLYQERFYHNNIKFIAEDNNCSVYGDEKQIFQVIENLISNAVKFIKPNSDGKIEIIANHPSERIVELCVKDNGIGIDPKYNEKIFEIFHRLKDHKTAVDGTGVGLTIVKRIIDAHKGKIWVVSELNKGSEFWIQLPMA